MSRLEDWAMLLGRCMEHRSFPRQFSCCRKTMFFCCQEREDVRLNPGRKDQKMLSKWGYNFRARNILPCGHTHWVVGPFLPLQRNGHWVQTWGLGHPCLVLDCKDSHVFNQRDAWAHDLAIPLWPMAISSTFSCHRKGGNSLHHISN